LKSGHIKTTLVNSHPERIDWLEQQQQQSDRTVKNRDYRHALVDILGRQNEPWHVSWHTESPEVPDLTWQQQRSRYT